MHPEPTLEPLLQAIVNAVREQILAELPTNETSGTRLLTVKAAAEYLGRTEGAVRQLIHKRILPVIRFDTAVRIDRRDLDQMIENARV